MEINDFNHFPDICQSTSEDTIASGCDGGPLKTKAIIVLNHDRLYNGHDEEGTGTGI